MDSRQLKVCATCFDLSVSLLRVLEMTVTLAPEIFLDWNRPSSELLLRRLAQVLAFGRGRLLREGAGGPELLVWGASAESSTLQHAPHPADTAKLCPQSSVLCACG